jgi:hypothetical protein
MEYAQAAIKSGANLNSPRAITINIEIMRAFAWVRAFAASHQNLAKHLTELNSSNLGRSSIARWEI